MHELSITRALIDIVLKECEEKGVMSVNSVTAELGGLTSYKKDPIIFYFDQLKLAIPSLEHASLVVQEAPGKVECSDCAGITEIEDPILIFCAKCNSHNVKIISGNEFTIKGIDGD